MPFKKIIFYTIFFILLFIISCGGGDKSYPEVDGEVVQIHHSSLLTIVDCDGYSVVDIADPWGDNQLARYLLVPADSVIPDGMPSGILLCTPLENVLVFSGVHAMLLEELGVIGSIKGVCDAQYIYCDAVSDRVASGDVVNCGNSLNVNSEAVMQLSPDAVFVLPFENGGFGKLEKLRLPLVQCAEYMETSPLGCAEWIRFYGRLFGKAALGDSIFFAVCDEYEALSKVALSAGEFPRLMCELKSSSAWYVPSAESTMGRMYTDAGADYLFSFSKGRGSTPLSFETVLDKAADADVWLFKYNSPIDKTYSSLLSEFPGYSHFAPFKMQNIYACNTHRKHIFEETAFHPERLLKELIEIFHPGLIPGYTMRYYEKMCR